MEVSIKSPKHLFHENLAPEFVKRWQLYLWHSGPKPPCQAGSPLSGSDDQTEQVYENMELLNRPVVEADQKVVHMNTNDEQRQGNQLVSHILTLPKSVQTGSSIENAELFHSAVALLY